MAKSKDEARIKFIAETSEFTSGIKDCDSALAGMRSELKLNSTQMQGAGRTTELLTQRQELLSGELETAKEKVRLTTEKLEAAKRIYGEDSEEVRRYARQLTEAKNQEQAIQNALDATNRELKEAKSGWKQFQTGAKEAGDKLQAVGDKITGVGKQLSVLSAGVMAVGAASYAAWQDVDEAYDTIIKKTGATGEALEGLQDSFDAVFTSIPAEAADVGTAIGEVNTRFGATGEALEELSTQFLEFAAINDTDVNNSIDSVDRIMVKFGVDAGETSGVLGLMTKAGQDTGISMDTLFSALETNGSALKELGLDLSGSINLLAQMEASGVDTSTAMAGLKKAVTNAAKEGKTLDEALAETIGAIQSAETETEALTIAQELFGTKGAAEMTQAIREGRFSVDELAESMSDYATVVEDTYNATLDPVDEIGVSLNELKLVGAELFESIQTAALPIIEGLAEGVHRLSDWFSGLSDEQRQTIVVIGGIVAAAGPLLVVLGTLISSIGAVVAAIGAISAPVLIVVGVIAGLIAIGVLLYKNWDTITAKATALKNNVVTVWNGIKTGVSNAATNVLSTVKTRFEAVKYAITHPIETAKNTVRTAINAIRSLFNITLKFAGIKLPHISIGWKTTGVIASAAKLLGLKGVPSFSVQWYARGAVLNRPTIFGASGGSLMAGGEAGPEAVAPISVLQGYVATAVERAMGWNRLDRLISIAETIAAKDSNFYLDSTRMARAGAPSADRVNGQRQNLTNRGLAL